VLNDDNDIFIIVKISKNCLFFVRLGFYNDSEYHPNIQLSKMVAKPLYNALGLFLGKRNDIYSLNRSIFVVKYHTIIT